MFKELVNRIVQSPYKPMKMALIVRSDISLSKGKTAAQCAHASILCYQKSSQTSPDKISQWCAKGQPKIVLKVNCLDEMESIHRNAQALKIVSKFVRDAGRTQVSAGTITCLGIGPDYDENIDKLVGHLKLL